MIMSNFLFVQISNTIACSFHWNKR